MLAIAIPLPWLAQLLRGQTPAMKAKAIAFTLLLALPANAQAKPLYVPVRIQQDTVVCKSLSSLVTRESLVQEDRTERLSQFNLVMGASGECWPAPQGKYMFYEGYDAKSSGAYICLRPRAGADCLWANRGAVGEITTVYPGRKLFEANKGVSCAAWAALLKKSAENDKAIQKKWAANNPSGDGNPVTEIAQGFVTGVIGGFTGGPDSHKVRSLNLCQMYLSSAQEQARRLTAYNACPQLVPPDKLAAEATYYQNNITEINNSCLDDR